MYRNIIKQIFLMKYKINSKSLLVLFLMGVISFSFMACSDSNSSGGQPEITGVKILSSDTLNYSYDEYYTKAGPGSMIAIEGKNLGGALKVFINNQELTFNTTMNTDHSIIVSIPTEEKGFKLSAFEDVPDEIRVETRGGVATYEFKVTAPGPQLQRIQAEYPRVTGDEIILHGLNLVDIEDAYFSDVTVEELAESESKEIGGNHVAISNIETVLMDHHLASNNSYVTTSILKFAMPEVPYQSGVIVLECAAGTTYIAYYKVPGQPTITSISSDMPQIGEDLIIKGTEFVQVESVKYGDVTLTEDEFEVNEEQTQITVPFAKKPSAGSEAKLTVTTPGGTVSVDRFYDYSTILTTFNKDDAPADIKQEPIPKVEPVADESLNNDIPVDLVDMVKDRISDLSESFKIKSFEQTPDKIIYVLATDEGMEKKIVIDLDDLIKAYTAKGGVLSNEDIDIESIVDVTPSSEAHDMDDYGASEEEQHQAPYYAPVAAVEEENEEEEEENSAPQITSSGKVSSNNISIHSKFMSPDNEE